MTEPTEPSDFDHHDAVADQRRRGLPDLPGFGPPTPTPSFVRVAMGLAPGPAARLHPTNPPIRRRGRTLAPSSPADQTAPTEPPTNQPTANQRAEPASAVPAQPRRTDPTSNQPAVPTPTDPATRPLGLTDQARAVSNVVATVVALPLVLLLIILVTGLLLGPEEAAPVVVNDRSSCDPSSVQTISPHDLAATDWWNDCNDLLTSGR